MACSRIFRLVLALLCSTTAALAWDWDDRPIWSDGGIPLEIQLGDSPTFADGNTPNALGLTAAQTWNDLMSRVRFLPTVASTASRGLENGINNVTFESTIAGEAFPRGVLGVSISFEDGVRRTEADVIINSSETWDSYSGALHTDTTDMLRVLIHELGHNLGLDHPDEAGQDLNALMNAYVSDTDGPTADDKDAIATFYGYTTANPGRVPDLLVNLPGTLSIQDYATLTLSVGARGRGPIQYQWFKDEQPIAGENRAYYQVDYAHAADAGTYHVTATNLLGTTTSISCNVSISPVTVPTITGSSEDVVTSVGSAASFAVTVASGVPVVFDWFKDGRRVDGNESIFSIPSVTASHAGSYYCVARNLVGETISRTFTLTLTETLAPLIDPYEARIRVSTIDSPLALETGDVTGDLTVKWFHNGEPVNSASGRYLNLQQHGLGPGNVFAVVNSGSGAITTPTVHVDRKLRSSRPLQGWTSVRERNGIVYFLQKAPTRLQRYDLATDTWLNPIALGAGTTAFAVSNTHLFVADNKVLYRHQLDGTLDGSFATFEDPVAEMLATDLGLFVTLPESSYRGGLMLLDYETLSLKPIEHSIAECQVGLSYAPSHRKLFGRSYFSGWARAAFTEWGSDGSLVSALNRTYESDVGPLGSMQVFPDESRVTEASGIISSTTDLSLVGFVGAYDSAAFSAEGNIITARGGRLYTHDSALHRTGWINVATDLDHLAVMGTKIVGFSPATNVNDQPLAHLYSTTNTQAFAAAPPSDLNSTAFNVDQVLVDRNGTHLLYSRVLRNLREWHPESGTWGTTIPLLGSPKGLSYSAIHHSVYATYADGTITRIRLGGTPSEDAFLRCPTSEGQLEVIGNYLFLISGFHCVYDHDANLVYYHIGRTSRTTAWSENQRRLYWINDHVYPNDLLYSKLDAAGTPVTAGESPYHGTFNGEALVFGHPILLSPDESQIALGSGMIFSTSDLTVVKKLGWSSPAMAWTSDALYVTRATTGAETEILKLSKTDFSTLSTTTVPGFVNHLVSTSAGGVAVYWTSNFGSANSTLSANLEYVAGDPLQTDIARPLPDATVPRPEPSLPNESIDIPDPSIGSVAYLAPGIPPPDPNAIPLVTTRLVNLSTRVQLTSDSDGLLVAGFVIGGSNPVTALIRAIGPKLETFGVQGVLPNPSIRIYNQATDVIAENDDWSTGDAEQTARIVNSAATVGAFPLDEGSADSALLITLPPGPYTAHVDRGDSDGGVVLLEIYDTGDGFNSGQLSNLSTRVRAGSGDATLTAGFVVAGKDPLSILVRASGPALARFGVPDLIENPVLSVRSGDDEVARNDDWQGNAEVSSTASQVGAFPFNDPEGLDAALLTELAPGPYTAQVNGSENGDEGTALVEVYRVEN